MFGSIQDFQPIAEHIIAKGLKEPYNWDEYASCFFGTAEKLGQTAAVAQQEGDTDKAREYYLSVPTSTSTSTFTYHPRKKLPPRPSHHMVHIETKRKHKVT